MAAEPAIQTRSCKLTNSTVRAAAPEAKRYMLWDTELKGFGLRVEPTGHRAFVVRYRSGGGGRSAAQKFMRLGKGGESLSAEEARKLARRILGEVANGKDPAGSRAAKRNERSIADVLDTFLRAHGGVHYKASTLKEAQRLVERVIKPALGSVKVGDLTRGRVKSWHQGMVDAPYVANRALAFLRSALNIAVKEWELLADNPAAGIKPFPEKARERFFSEDELTRLGAAIAELEGEAAPGCGVALRLLALTGMRLGEVLSLRWDYVDFDRGCARLPDAKAGARPVPLGGPVLAYLSSLPRLGEYVCEAIEPSKPLHLKTFRRFWKAVRDKSGISDARPHDFRHTVGTYVSQAGANAFTVRDVLGHKTLVMASRYVSRDIAALHPASDQVAGRIAAAMQGQGCEVVPFEPKRRA